MKKKVLLLLGVFYLGLLSAQIGINTENPLKLFHIDGGVIGTFTDDIVITDAGNVGIGTNVPSNKLTVYKEGVLGDNTGLQLLHGSGAGKVLASDAVGNSTWTSGAVQFQTLVQASGARTTKNAKLPLFDKVDNLNVVNFDSANDIFGGDYGWQAGNSQYKVPRDGIYRVTVGVYFQTMTAPTNLGVNYRAYLHKRANNGSGALTSVYESGIVSVTNEGLDIAAHVMGLCRLNKDDIVDLRVTTADYSGVPNNGDVAYYGGTGHTYIVVESL